MTTDLTSPERSGSTTTAGRASAPARLSAFPVSSSRCSSRCSRSCPLGYVIAMTVRDRLGHRRRPDLPAARRRAAAQHRPAHAGHGAAVPRARRRRRLARRADPAARPQVLGRRCSPPRWPSRPSSTATPGCPPCRPSTGLWSGVLIATLSYFPLVYIPAAATLSRLDPAHRAVRGLPGARRRGGSSSGWCCPSCGIAMTGGALLVGLHLLAEYGAFAMIRFDTFTTAIMVQYQSTFNGTAGNMLASVLVVPVPDPAPRARSAAAAPPATPASAPAARPSRCACRWHAYHVPAQLALLALTVLAFGLPLCVRRCAGSSPAARRSGRPTSSSRPCCQTLLYGAGRRRGDHRRRLPHGLPGRAASRAGSASRLELSNYVTSSMPGIVVGLAFVTVSIRLLPGIYQTAGRPDRGLRPAVPAARPGQPPLRPGPGAQGTRRGRAGAGQAAPSWPSSG